jgi:hypothetical protein
MGNALINFTQGSSVGGAGFALIGTVGTPVVVSNGDDSDIVNWQFTVVDVGVGSANAQGIVQNGGTPTYSFTPDVSGCYVVNLITTDNQGNLFSDTRVFGILETSGRLIPSYLGTDKAMNFVISAVENTKGWSPFLQAYLKQVDAGGGDSLWMETGGIGGSYQPVDTTASFAWASGATASSGGFAGPLATATGSNSSAMSGANALGTQSFAACNGTANGVFDFAAGEGSVASNGTSVGAAAFGGAFASNDGAFACCAGTASSANDFAAGADSVANGGNSVAFGGGTSSGSSSFAHGASATATNTDDFSGAGGFATGGSSVAFNGATASGPNSFAANNAGASGSNSFAAAGGNAAGDFSFCVGQFNTTFSQSYALGGPNTIQIGPPYYVGFTMNLDGNGSVELDCGTSQSLTLGNVANQTTVGAAGGASLLPVSPDLYLLVNINDPILGIVQKALPLFAPV